MIAGHQQRRAREILKQIFRICPTTNDRVRARPMTPPDSGCQISQSWVTS